MRYSVTRPIVSSDSTYIVLDMGPRRLHKFYTLPLWTNSHLVSFVLSVVWYHLVRYLNSKLSVYRFLGPESDYSLHSRTSGELERLRSASTRFTSPDEPFKISVGESFVKRFMMVLIILFVYIGNRKLSIIPVLSNDEERDESW